MIVLLEKIKSSKYLKNLAILTSGTIIAQFVLVAISPLLTRIYSVEELGLFALLASLISLFTPVMNARYDISIVNAKTLKEANALAVAAFAISLIFSFLLFLGLFFYNILFPKTFSELGLWIYLLIPIFVLLGLTNVLTSYNNRYLQYKLISKVSVIRSTVQALTQILFGLTKLGIIGLTISQFLSVLMSIKTQAKFAFDERETFKGLKYTDIISVIRIYKNQALFSTPAIFLNSLSNSMLVFFITILYGVIELGYFSIAFKVLGLPIVIISVNVAKVYFEKANRELNDRGNFSSTYNKTFLLLSSISIPFFIILMLVSSDLFELVFGEGWGRAGTFVAILAPMYLIKFVASSLSLSLILVNKQKVELLIQMLFVLVGGTVFILCYMLDFNIYTFLTLISSLYSLVYILMLLITFKYSKEEKEFKNGNIN